MHVTTCQIFGVAHLPLLRPCFMAVSSLSSLPPSKKRRRIDKIEAENVQTLENISDLEKSVAAALESSSSLNPLADLLHIASSTHDVDVAIKAVFALYRLFTLIIEKGILRLPSDEDSGARAVRSWVLTRLDAFADLLCRFLQDEEKTMRVRGDSMVDWRLLTGH